MTDRLVLVTGASGNIGHAACASLRARGWRVRALVHRRPVSLVDEQVEGALEDPRSLARAALGVDAVLHLAAVTHARRPALYERLNLRGTVSLLEAARTTAVDRFVFASTRAISPTGGAYSRSKNAAEQAVEGSGLRYTIVRLPEVYGAGGTEGVDRIIELARRGWPIPLFGADSERLCPVHADDILPPLLAALESDRCLDKTYTLAGDCLTLREFAHACVSAFSSESRIVNLPMVALRVLAAAGRLLPLPVYPDQVARLLAPKPEATPDAFDELRFRPRSLEEGLRALA